VLFFGCSLVLLVSAKWLVEKSWVCCTSREIGWEDGLWIDLSSGKLNYTHLWICLSSACICTVRSVRVSRWYLFTDPPVHDTFVPVCFIRPVTMTFDLSTGCCTFPCVQNLNSSPFVLFLHSQAVMYGPTVWHLSCSYLLSPSLCITYTEYVLSVIVCYTGNVVMFTLVWWLIDVTCFVIPSVTE